MSGGAEEGKLDKKMVTFNTLPRETHSSNLSSADSVWVDVSTLLVVVVVFSFSIVPSAETVLLVVVVVVDVDVTVIDMATTSARTHRLLD